MKFVMKNLKSLETFKINEVKLNSKIQGGLSDPDCGHTTITYTFDEEFHAIECGDWIDTGCCLKVREPLTASRSVVSISQRSF